MIYCISYIMHPSNVEEEEIFFYATIFFVSKIACFVTKSLHKDSKECVILVVIHYGIFLNALYYASHQRNIFAIAFAIIFGIDVAESIQKYTYKWNSSIATQTYDKVEISHGESHQEFEQKQEESKDGIMKVSTNFHTVVWANAEMLQILEAKDINEARNKIDYMKVG